MKHTLRYVRAYLETLSATIRIGIAILISIVIIFLTRYGGNITTADVLFAEMFHTVADALVLIILFASYFLRGVQTKILGKISGLLLFVAGSVAIMKAYTTFAQLFTTHGHAVQRSGVLITISLVVMLLILIQILLIGKEHSLLHGHNDEHEGTRHGLHSVHSATQTELWSDAIQASTGLVEGVCIMLIPDAPLAIRFLDMTLTLGVGWWMIKRGLFIIVGSDNHHRHHHS